MQKGFSLFGSIHFVWKRSWSRYAGKGSGFCSTLATWHLWPPHRRWSCTPNSGICRASATTKFCHKLTKELPTSHPVPCVLGCGNELHYREGKLSPARLDALNVVVPLGPLHMRKIQRWFGCLRLDPVWQKKAGQPSLSALRLVHQGGTGLCCLSHNEWKLSPTLVQMLWDRFRQVKVDLFASQEKTQCALWFSMNAQDSPLLGVDAFSQRLWPRALLDVFHSGPLIPHFLADIQEEALKVILVTPGCTHASLFPTTVQLLAGKPKQLPWRI